MPVIAETLPLLAPDVNRVAPFVEIHPSPSPHNGGGAAGQPRKVIMKKLLTGGFVGVATLASSLALPMAAAHAAGVTTATANTGNTPYSGKINSNLDIPAGVTYFLNGAEVTGNVTVEGTLKATNVTFDKNVIVNGGHFQFINTGSTVDGNLIVTSSSSDDVNGFWDNHGTGRSNLIMGNFNYEGNAAQLFVWGDTTTVQHVFNYDQNGSTYAGGLAVAGQQNIS
jgi:hypothetical protein